MWYMNRILDMPYEKKLHLRILKKTEYVKVCEIFRETGIFRRS